MAAAPQKPDLHELVNQLNPAQAAAVRAVILQIVTPGVEEIEPVETMPRKLPFVGAGASGTGITDRIDELLSQGFGRD